MREGRAAATARTARRGSRAVSRVAVREAIAVSRVVTIVASFHHASSPPPRRAPCRRRHCSVTREGRTREETEPRGSSATEREDARQICRRQSAHRQTTSLYVKLSPSPLPEVAIGAAAPFLSFFFL
ncbi:hypothetical protein S83_069697 [Arachis hypogaea]|nr:uncharacterized protein DS421_20g688120 [Arachis hypogaea]